MPHSGEFLQLFPTIFSFHFFVICHSFSCSFVKFVSDEKIFSFTFVVPVHDSHLSAVVNQRSSSHLSRPLGGRGLSVGRYLGQRRWPNGRGEGKCGKNRFCCHLSCLSMRKECLEEKGWMRTEDWTFLCAASSSCSPSRHLASISRSRGTTLSTATSPPGARAITTWNWWWMRTSWRKWWNPVGNWNFLPSKSFFFPNFFQIFSKFFPNFFHSVCFLKCSGIDLQLARHMAHLFIRDPVSLFSEKINQDDENESDHFEVKILSNFFFFSNFFSSFSSFCRWRMLRF